MTRPINELDGRYVLTNVERSGAQGTVVKALDKESAALVAVKRAKFGPDDQRAGEGFQREAMMLQTLNHPNIVQLIEVGRDPENNWYLVLEWIDDNLEDVIARDGAMPWPMFWDCYGGPLIDAVIFGQKKRVAHRDIKPKNILVTDVGIPKLADYGIAKLLDNGGSWGVKGYTFRFDHTPGYTPNQAEDEKYVFSRDCFSFAAVALSCVTGRIINSQEDIATTLQEATLPKDVRPILERCLSEDPAARPRLASVLKGQIDQAMLADADEGATAVSIHLILSAQVQNALAARIDVDGQAALERFMHGELDEVCSLLPKEADGEDIFEKLEIVGATWRFEAIIAGKDKATLHISRASEVGAGHASDLRELGSRQRLQITFKRPIDSKQAGRALEMVLIEARSAQRSQEAEREARATQRVFRAWRGYLRDRADLEARRDNAIQYVDRHISGERVTYTTEIAQKEEIIGQDRMVKLHTGRIGGKISAVSFNQVTMEITFGNPHMLPRRGYISINTIAAQRALTHQTQALDAVVFGRSVSEELKPLILEPHNATPATPVTDVTPTDADFDEEKIAILSQALGMHDVLAVEGPPGTGKTKLITEIVVQWLRRNPHQRILLSSQTHIALDNVLGRLAELDPKMELVRIGRFDDPKISEESKKLLLEKRLETWVTEVRQLAEAEMTRWAVENGVDRATVEVGMKVEQLLQILKRQSDLRDAIKEIRVERDEVSGDEAQSGIDDDEETTQLDSEIGTLEREVQQLLEEERKLRCDMMTIGSYAKELAESKDIDDLADWAGHFLKMEPTVDACRARLALLEEWGLRVGRSPDFNAALLSSAQVIAGTCVGIASVKGMEEVAYDLCIVDEASKATATEILIPMVRSRRWIIVGDPKQLPPFFEELGDDLRAEFEDKEVKATLLDRLLDDRDGLPQGCRAALRNQYRMVKPIGDLVSECFYEKQLNSPIKNHGLKLEHAFPKPVMWYSTHNLENRTERIKGQTFSNLAEVAAIRLKLQRLQFIAKMQKRRISVAVIAGYTAQVELLREMESQGVAEWQNLDVVCNSVDSFQGRQADVCIYSVVRSNKRRNLGFLREHPRLNVALSRGKSALVIVGDQVFCRQVPGNNPFKPVIDYMDRNREHCETEELS
ncbi:AAA domain-containing protein [Nisaea sp.]|uniref:AAA domain-containing protein n=1 Tax=Nisaea sp. TaxID=2024842 RepID=UPI0032984552